MKIGTDLPLSGDDAPDGLPVRTAVQLAIQQAGSVCGFSAHSDACVRLQAVIDDDVNKGIHDPAKGAANIQAMARDSSVVGVIGPLYDGVARSEIPVANGARLALITPANTDECLTQEPADGRCHGLAAKLRPHGANSYFRVVTTEIVEGAAGADLGTKTLGKRRAFVLNDGSPFDQAQARTFADHFHHDGGTVVNPTDLGAFDPSQPFDAGAAVTKAKTLRADVIYFAGSELAAAAALRREMAAQTPDVPLIAGDRLGDDQFAKSAGAAVSSTYYTVVGVDPIQLRSATAFVRDYRARSAGEPTGLSLQAFAATTVLIRAIAHAIDDAGGNVPSRQQVLTEVAATRDLDTAMGRLGFDNRGDCTLKVLTAYQWLAPTDASGHFTATIVVT